MKVIAAGLLALMSSIGSSIAGPNVCLLYCPEAKGCVWSTTEQGGCSCTCEPVALNNENAVPEGVTGDARETEVIRLKKLADGNYRYSSVTQSFLNLRKSGIVLAEHQLQSDGASAPEGPTKEQIDDLINSMMDTISGQTLD